MDGIQVTFGSQPGMVLAVGSVVSVVLGFGAVAYAVIRRSHKE